MDFIEAKSLSTQIQKIGEGFHGFEIVLAFNAGEEAVKAIWEDQQKQQLQNWCVRLSESESFWTPDQINKCVIQDHNVQKRFRVLFARGRYICTYNLRVYRLATANKLYLQYLRKHRFKLNKQQPLGVIL